MHGRDIMLIYVYSSTLPNISQQNLILGALPKDCWGNLIFKSIHIKPYFAWNPNLTVTKTNYDLVLGLLHVVLCCLFWHSGETASIFCVTVTPEEVQLLCPYREGIQSSRVIVPLNVNLCARLRRAVNFAPRPLYPRHSLIRRLGGTQRRTGRFGEQKGLLLLPEIETRLFQPIA